MAGSSEIEFTCPHCSGLFIFPRKYAGKKGKCPDCGRSVTIPRPGQQSEVRTDPASEEMTDPRNDQTMAKLAWIIPVVGGVLFRLIRMGRTFSEGKLEKPLFFVSMLVAAGILFGGGAATINAFRISKRNPSLRKHAFWGLALILIMIGAGIVGFLSASAKGDSGARWKTVMDPDKTCQVELPVPVQRTQADGILGRDTFNALVMAGEVPDILFKFTEIIFREGVDPDMTGLVKKICDPLEKDGGKTSSEQGMYAGVPIDVIKVREYSPDMHSSLNGEIRLIRNKNRIYVIEVYYTGNKSEKCIPVSSRFFNSFKIRRW